MELPEIYQLGCSGWVRDALEHTKLFGHPISYSFIPSFVAVYSQELEECQDLDR